MPRDLPSSHAYLTCPTDVVGKPAGCSTILRGATFRTANFFTNEQEVHCLRRRQLCCLLPDRQAGLAESQLAGGNCEFFWTSGECRRGFDCIFRHVRQPQIRNAGTAESPPEATSAETDTLDFLTTEGLAGINSISLDKLHTMGPAEAHNMFKLFNTPMFQFTGPDRVIQFVQILASVDRRNPQWVRSLHNTNTSSNQTLSQDTVSIQSFLGMIVDLKVKFMYFFNCSCSYQAIQHHVLARIREVLQYSPIACRAGTGFTVLSFQIGYFPLLQVTVISLPSTTSHTKITVLWVRPHPQNQSPL